jgi:D-alanine-D-alanine ligase
MSADALRRLGHTVAEVDLFLGTDGGADSRFTSAVPARRNRVEVDVPDLESLKRTRRGGTGRIGGGVIELCRASELVFLALHGADGEDGKVQSLLDLLEIKYTGTGAFGSALAMNKSAAKDVMRAHGITPPRGKAYSRGDKPEWDGEFPCIVKPCSGGSSVGAGVARDAAGFRAALETALAYDEYAVAEELIAGREIDVAVLGGTALPPVEIITESGFFDYRNKYQTGAAREICPAELTEDAAARLALTAESVFRALRLDVYARMDFILPPSGGIYCLEANTLPGLTPSSLLPQEAAAAGLTYDGLIDEIVRLSLKKYGEKH